MASQNLFMVDQAKRKKGKLKSFVSFLKEWADRLYVPAMAAAIMFPLMHWLGEVGI